MAASASPTNSSSANLTVTALLSFKAAISSDPTDFLSSWSTSIPFCSWQGIRCSNSSQQVEGLLLDSKQLVGKLAPQVADLQGLSYLNVSNNSLDGLIPTRVGELAATLTHFDLSVNNFSGSIPSSLARCTLLKYIDLNSNSLTGKFPAYITNFTQLGYFDLSSNDITGELPSDIGLLSNLQFFQVYETFITGSIPASLMNCSNLVWLDLANPFLSGPLPSDWTKLASTLQQLKLMDSNLSGVIPPSLGNCTFLTALSLQNNSFVGDIPDSFGQLSRLQDIRLFYNYLSGPIPSSITNCTLLVYLQLSYNNLSGVIPSDIGRLTRAEWITLSGNPFLEGRIPDSIGGCTQLLVLSLFESSLGGSLPSSLFNLTNLQRLTLRECKFSGRLSGLVGQLTSLADSLDLGYNAFEGPIPAELGELKQLQGLYLQGNNFAVSIPHQLSGLIGISEMDLSFNPISGSIPPSFAELSSLNQLTIRNTRLSGPIPDIFANLSRLEELDLAQNMFTGLIPASLATLYTLSVSLDLSSNNLTGAVPSSVGGMLKLQSMNLSDNSLSGKIPPSFGDCQGMQTLDLSNNKLEGEIPDALGQMMSLRYLNLSHNELSGALPSSLGLLDGLLSLNVSYNALEGTIPTRGVYTNLSEFSFVGNPALCGYPSSTSCGSPPADHSKRKTTPIILIACVAGGAILAAVVCACMWWWCCMGKPKDRDTSEEVVDGDLEEGESFDIEMPQFKAWTVKELQAATNDFAAANVLGSGAVSVCYKGMMEDVKGAKKRVVAVKRLNVGPDSYGVEARRSFVNELRTICKARHRNLVKVSGYCVDGGEVALVMEYMEEGDLDGHLYGARKGSFCWDDRLNVALDVAEGLVYLHHEYVQPIIHCDLKPKNILLGTDRVAKISDFGIAKLLDLGEAADMSISKFRGTFGYAAPEYATGTRISTKADVYSYGVLLLELVTGLRPTDAQLQEEGMSLHTWARMMQEAGRGSEVLDKALLVHLHEGDMNNSAIAIQAEELLALGVKCSKEIVKERPSMQLVRDLVAHLHKQRLPINKLTSYPALDELLQAPDHPVPDHTKLLLDPSIQFDSSGLLSSTNSSSI
ncbi:hypothetical protein GOP47_0024817 [Adiantum capillus-veneris]|uniref:non-specific serine/threonine protein kinase n=1 Tax=Adiantum capillus-veneris TaxID=13818 RepID=A0A9D4Z4P2_ADICA|nr:hypothetical protein GOP47_0024817 [Adiantum capillus-veneris]